MRLTIEQIVEKSEELADYAESFDPERAQQMPIAEYRLWRVVRTHSANPRQVLDAMTEAHGDGVSIDRIADIVGVSVADAVSLCDEAVARQRTT